MFDITTVSLPTMFKLGFAAIAVLVALIVFFKERKLWRSLRLASKIPGPSLWEFGTVHARQFLSNAKFLKHFFEMTANYDYKPWCFRKGLDLVVVISDPDAIGAAFKSKNLEKKAPKIYDGVTYHIGPNSLVLNGPEWKLRRTLTSTAFSKTYLEPQLDVMYEEALRSAKEILAESGKSDFSIEHAASSVTVRTTLRVFYSKDSVYDQKLMDDFIWYESAIAEFIHMKMFNVFKYWFMCLSDRARVRKYARLLNQLRCMLVGDISKVVDRLNLGLPVDDTVFVFLLKNYLNTNALSEEEILSEAIFLIGAALDTTSTALSATLFMLALHPKVQTQAAEEIRNIFGDSDRPVMPEDLSQMQYLDRVIKEAMRLFPSVGLIIRHADDDTDLNGTVVPKGCSVLFNIYALHRNPNVFKDPLKFDPDRFSPGAAKDRHPYAFLPFSSGMRNCAGRLHAMMMLKTVVSTYLRHFKILPGREMNSVEDIKTKFTFSITMNGNSVRIVPLCRD